MAISIIVPVLNEAAQIEETLCSLGNGAEDTEENDEIEVIVVDGGSRDRTVELACSAGAKVVRSPPGRANQMNRGAAIATGDVLLFLHADTRLPTHYPKLVKEALADPATIAGAFALKIDGQGCSLRFIEKMVNLRSRVLSFPYGDQALFLKADLFKQMKGFANFPIMEDFEFVQRLQQHGRICIIPDAALTSARRWQKLGAFQTTLINQLIIVGYFVGVPPATLARWYKAPVAWGKQLLLREKGKG